MMGRCPDIMIVLAAHKFCLLARASKHWNRHTKPHTFDSFWITENQDLVKQYFGARAPPEKTAEPHGPKRPHLAHIKSPYVLQRALQWTAPYSSFLIRIQIDMAIYLAEFRAHES